MEESQPNSPWYEIAQKDLADPVFTNFSWNGRTTDWFLQELVGNVNRYPEARLSITLFTMSGMLSGTLISAEEYFQLFADSFCQGWESEEKKATARSYFLSLGPSPSKDEASSLTEDAPSQYIHLKNAKHFSPTGEVPNNDGLLWRGTIASISGFSLGQLQRVQT
ncbi:hypothetical protein ACP0IK_10575 [Pseudomonas aeruginosa]|nr:hypothetical protein [Pseudomonas aeruginosa]HCE6819937.1 hypothetical protein [Pseudomonas aeruginosa]HCE9946187.1 hypothetical protein [Pseudomonas aeruginosa]